MVDSINFKLVAFIFFFFAYADSVFIRRISKLCLFPNGGMKYNLFCLYLSFTKKLFPSPSRPSLLPGWLWVRRCNLKKVYRKKKVSPPHQQKPTLSPVMLYKYLRWELKTIYNNFEAYLNILFCSHTSFSYTKKKLAYAQLKMESYLII